MSDYPKFQPGQAVRITGGWPSSKMIGFVVDIRRIEPHWDELEFLVEWTEERPTDWYRGHELDKVTNALISLAHLAPENINDCDNT